MPRTAGGRRPSDHRDVAFGIEPGDGVGAFVNDPDVVLRVDAHAVRELEVVRAFADLTDVDAVLIELEQPRVGAARVDEDMPLRNWSRCRSPRPDTVPGGILKKFGTESYGISGTFCAVAFACAKAGAAHSSTARNDGRQTSRHKASGFHSGTDCIPKRRGSEDDDRLPHPVIFIELI